MRISNKKQAYSLAEIMTVMLVLTVVFASLAPFMTKRRVEVKSLDTPWQLADYTTFDARTEPGNNSSRNQMFFGVSPKTGDEVASRYTPLAKLVIRSGPVTGGVVQRQLQFRYGSDNESASFKYTDRGKFAGTWLMDGKNVLMGGRYAGIQVGTGGARHNTAIGYDSLNKITNGSGNTAVGYNALSNVTNNKYNVAVGYNAGIKLNSTQNTYAGAFAGQNQTGSRNTAIGYNAAGYASSGNGNDNLYIGAYAGQSSNTAYQNTAIGYNALGYKGSTTLSGHDNVALGYGALKNLTSGSYNVAIGYNACSNLTSGSYKTCIGANSGPAQGTTTGVKNFIKGWEDDVQRTYIGSKPHNYGGDAVLEIHNPEAPNNNGATHGIRQYLAGSASNTTTVINGNLIIRGKTYFTSGSTLYHIHGFTTNNDGEKYLFGAQKSIDECSSSPTSYYFNKTNCQVFHPTSDRRLKNIGAKNNDGLDKLSQLKIYNYTFKNDPKKEQHVGVMAQDLQKVFPNSVFKGDDGFLRIRWDEMFFATINAVKELDRKIIALINRTFRVESQIAKLEKENVLLKNQVEQLTVRVNKLKAQ